MYNIVACKDLDAVEEQLKTVLDKELHSVVPQSLNGTTWNYLVIWRVES